MSIKQYNCVTSIEIRTHTASCLISYDKVVSSIPPHIDVCCAQRLYYNDVIQQFCSLSTSMHSCTLVCSYKLWCRPHIFWSYMYIFCGFAFSFSYSQSPQWTSMSLYLSVCMSVCLSVRLSISLSLSLAFSIAFVFASWRKPSWRQQWRIQLTWRPSRGYERSMDHPWWGRGWGRPYHWNGSDEIIRQSNNMRPTSIAECC